MYSERIEQLIAALAALALAAFGALVARDGVSQLWLLPTGIAFVVLAAAQVLYRRRRTYVEVEACLDLLLAQLAFPQHAGVRATYHEVRRDWRRVWRRRCFIQRLDYLPDRRYGKGRSFPVTKGIGRKAYEQKRPVAEHFATDAEWRQTMLNDYGYTKDELEERATDRRSYMAFPVLDYQGRVKALVWFDAREMGSLPPVGERQLTDLVDITADRISAIMG
jgi:hypothetical protein